MDKGSMNLLLSAVRFGLWNRGKDDGAGGPGIHVAKSMPKMFPSLGHEALQSRLGER